MSMTTVHYDGFAIDVVPSDGFAEDGRPNVGFYNVFLDGDNWILENVDGEENAISQAKRLINEGRL